MNNAALSNESLAGFPSAIVNWIKEEQTQMPLTIAKLVTPVLPELGKLTVIHPTTNDPALVSEKLGTVAIWFKF